MYSGLGNGTGDEPLGAVPTDIQRMVNRTSPNVPGSIQIPERLTETQVRNVLSKEVACIAQIGREEILAIREARHQQIKRKKTEAWTFTHSPCSLDSCSDAPWVPS